MSLIRYLTPDLFVDRVSDIDLDLLRSWDVEAIVLDLDNTIVPWHTSDLPDDAAAWIARAKSAGMRVCLLTNNYGSQARTVALRIGAALVRAALKPAPGGFRRALKALGAASSHALAIGDQLFTDVFGAKLVGMRAILVRPLSPREFVTTKLMRMLEKPILARSLRTAPK